jgi:hypothetical protein
MTDIPKERIVARTCLHATYIPTDKTRDDDAVLVSEIVENDKGETRPELRIFTKPKTTFWVTQPQYRNHTDKKEFENRDRLTEYSVYYKDKDKEIFKALNGYYPNFLSFKQRRELYQSPYLYGGNITIEARVAMKYKKDLAKQGKVSHTPTTGFFDIEKSLIPDSEGKLPLMTFTAENKVYLAMKRSFMYEEENGKMVPVTIDKIKHAVSEIIDPLVEEIFESEKDSLNAVRHKLPFTYEYFVGDTEVDMILWIFEKMHESKVSFIGIWNLNFDIPEIIKVLEEAGIPLKDVFAHPSLRNGRFAYANYRPDVRKVDHFTQKWHWLSATAHFQFVDSLALYSYIRTVDGKEASYALDDVLKKFGIGGKLKVRQVKDLEGLQQADWHRAMLGKYFTYYALYGMWDTMSLQILEWRNSDLTSMMLASDITPPKFFPNQTIKATNTLFEDWECENEILGTGVDVEGIADEDLLTAGGAVLEPDKLMAKGANLFKEWKSHFTRCFFWNNDVDFAALYPLITASNNISKQTKIATLVGVISPWVNRHYKDDDAVEVVCNCLITPRASGYDLGTEFFNLPRYEEMSYLFKEHISSRG